ncbi:MAG: hypothetical protein ACLQU3_13055 [Limisphaerales bacterium]
MIGVLIGIINARDIEPATPTAQRTRANPQQKAGECLPILAPSLGLGALSRINASRSTPGFGMALVWLWCGFGVEVILEQQAVGPQEFLGRLERAA